MPSSNKTSPAGGELVIRRTFDAPRALVWEAWTEAKHLREWMGPRAYPARLYENDFRVGGKWRACLKSINSDAEYWERGEYREIVPEERLVFTMAWDEGHPAAGPEMLATVTFADRAGMTEMIFRQQFLPSAEQRDSHERGWSGSFDRLDEHLAHLD